MIKASEIRNKVNKRKEELKQSEELKKKQDIINSELLEVEKALNEFYRNIDKENFDINTKYITVPIFITNDVMTILQKEEYYVERNISDRKTYLYFNNERWKSNIGKTIVMPCDIIKRDDRSKLDTSINTTNTCITNLDSNNTETKLHNNKEDERTITKDEDLSFQDIVNKLNKFRNNGNVNNFVKIIGNTDELLRWYEDNKGFVGFKIN